ncbi:hypothetical protein TRFO_19070 [Tritrichomonas foetus]|uniref:RRM domain-containing protein n=1 Tax=Tritrichomonas foetus TaxID=1144522 RepID=A0A1J4KJC9_9EUKA|nr:hypothetical protein TRFO_19070 [Tritrichomonas foetus]|eukprot:OHT11439.1 hypothetical protein TRFO_19070 [Tritrichomonas foetus]
MKGVHFLIPNFGNEQNIQRIKRMSCKNFPFLHTLNNNLLIQTTRPHSRHKMFKLLSESLSNELTEESIHLLNSSITFQDRLYFCHIPKKYENTETFKIEIQKFIKGKKLKFDSIFKEKVYILRELDPGDTERIFLFFKAAQNEMILSTSWFDLPIIRISNIPKTFPRDNILSTYANGIDVKYYEIQKSVSKDSQTVFCSLIVDSVENARKIVSQFNFSPSGVDDKPIYVNWYVDKMTLEELEKYTVKTAFSDDEFDNLDVQEYFHEIEKFGQIFKLSVNRNCQFATITFASKESAILLVKESKFSYLNARTIIYNFHPYVTTDDVLSYLNTININVREISLLSNEGDEKNLPFFNVTLYDIEDVQKVVNSIEENPHTFENVTMQPFCILPCYNSTSNIKKYRELQNKLTSSNTIKMYYLPSNVTATQVLNFCTNFLKNPIFSYFKLISCEDDKSCEATITFSERNVYREALEQLNNAHFNDSCTIKVLSIKDKLVLDEIPQTLSKIIPPQVAQNQSAMNSLFSTKPSNHQEIDVTKDVHKKIKIEKNISAQPFFQPPPPPTQNLMAQMKNLPNNDDQNTNQPNKIIIEKRENKQKIAFNVQKK